MTPGRLGQTPAQTIGPFFHALLGPGENLVAPDDSDGEHVLLRGRVLDGDDQVVDDALVELWQADGRGRYRHPIDDWPGDPGRRSFTGFGRCPTEPATGAFSFATIRPGPVPDPGHPPQAPHVALVVHARGLLNALHTRAYFADQLGDGADDPVVAAVPAERRATLMARPVADAASPTYHFDIRLQGADETVFFEF